MRQLGDVGVLVARPVERAGDDLALHRAAHVGDLFGPLVDEQHDQLHLGVVAARSTVAIVFMIVVLPAFGGDTMMPRWPLPIGRDRGR